ncbi:uncharacterized protein LOC126847601 [Adelges cooleyi]|uniref:uncharacterized protein LOC126847601 n=1 Tax=Adelges cooleyi TaxID=133065 RepID=UPI00217F9581|nr:uncharacterized protein LOC126847601 [Adelges cooleyi]
MHYRYSPPLLPNSPPPFSTNWVHNVDDDDDDNGSPVILLMSEVDAAAAEAVRRIQLRIERVFSLTDVVDLTMSSEEEESRSSSTSSVMELPDSDAESTDEETESSSSSADDDDDYERKEEEEENDDASSSSVATTTDHDTNKFLESKRNCAGYDNAGVIAQCAGPQRDRGKKRADQLACGTLKG